MTKPVWNVQPYRWLSELRRRYITVEVVGSRRAATKIAAEATVWMKRNAPWQDVTGNARKGLRAYVKGQEEEAAAYQAGMNKAVKEDKLALKRLNKKRENEFRESVRIQNELMKSSGLPASKLPSEFQARYDLSKPMRRLPENLSAESAFIKEQSQSRFPVATVVFTHNPFLKGKYGLWLEIANSGKYSIIPATMDYWGAKLMTSVRRIANLKQYQGMFDFGEEVSPEQEFLQHVARETQATGVQYKPFTKEIQRERQRRRNYRKRSR